MGYWPVNAAHVAVLLSLYQTRAPLTVTILSPAVGETVTVDNPTIEWDISSGAQVEYRVRIFEPDGVTQVYDSGAVVSATQSDTVTGGLLSTGVEGYILRVEVLNDAGDIGVSLSTFDTVFQPSVPVTGVRLVELGDKCVATSDPELPGVLIRWDQVVPGVGETFVQYTMLRRPAGTSAWTTIKTITDITTTRHIDYNFAARETNEYAVVWTALDGADTLVSLPVDPVPQASVDFDWTFLHDWADPDNWVAYFSLEQGEDIESDRSFDRLWGRQQPTLFVGEAEYATLSLTALPDLYNGDVWDDTRTLFARQRTAGSTIVVRNGIAGTRFFTSFSRLKRDLGQVQYETDTELIETYFDESFMAANA